MIWSRQIVLGEVGRWGEAGDYVGYTYIPQPDIFQRVFRCNVAGIAGEQVTEIAEVPGHGVNPDVGIGVDV